MENVIETGQRVRVIAWGDAYTGTVVGVIVPRMAAVVRIDGSDEERLVYAHQCRPAPRVEQTRNSPQSGHTSTPVSGL